MNKRLPPDDAEDIAQTLSSSTFSQSYAVLHLTLLRYQLRLSAAASMDRDAGRQVLRFSTGILIIRAISSRFNIPQLTQLTFSRL